MVTVILILILIVVLILIIILSLMEIFVFFCRFSKGKFAAIGLNSEIKSAYGDRCEEWYDATGQSVVPGNC